MGTTPPPPLVCQRHLKHAWTQGSFGLEVWSNDGGQDFVRLDEARGTTASGGITKCVHVVLQQQHHLLVMDDTLRLRYPWPSSYRCKLHRTTHTLLFIASGTWTH
jgi:hypothetical protein